MKTSGVKQDLLSTSPATDSWEISCLLAQKKQEVEKIKYSQQCSSLVTLAGFQLSSTTQDIAVS